MQASAEIRWFWTAPVAGLEDWFCRADAHSCTAGGGAIRVDEYLRAPGQNELGIKRRGTKKGIEVKGLVTVVWSGVSAPPFVGPIEVWTKWTSEILELGSAATVATEKQRWLRKFDTSASSPREVSLDADEKPRTEGQLPALGCNVELTRVKLPSGDSAWTLGFEAFGAIRTIENDLRAVAHVLAARRPPPLSSGTLASYPAWLSQHLR